MCRTLAARSFATVASALALFTDADLNEASERRRIAQVYSLRLAALGPAESDGGRVGHRTIREIVEHVATPWYAEQVGDVSRAIGKADARRT